MPSLDIETDKVIYLRPYKKNWSERRKNKRDTVPFHLWGKKDHPLTNMWLELVLDYEDIMRGFPIMKNTVEDQTLIKFLRQHKEKFSLIN